MQLEYLSETTTRYRERFVFYRNDLMIGQSLEHYGEYQQIELDFLLPFINRNTVVWDIGANIGYHATAFDSHAGQVHSFEPNASHFDLLTKNLRGGHNGRCYNIAVGDCSKSIMIEEFDPARVANYGAVRVGATSGKTVPMKPIDELCKFIAPPDFIKIDVEGHEWAVLQGGAETIKQRRPMIYFEAQETQDLGKIYPMLQDLGYEMTWVIVRNYNPNNFRQNQENIFSNSAIFSILAYQPGMVTGQTLPVLGPDDHWQRFCN